MTGPGELLRKASLSGNRSAGYCGYPVSIFPIQPAGCSTTADSSLLFANTAPYIAIMAVLVTAFRLKQAHFIIAADVV